MSFVTTETSWTVTFVTIIVVLTFTLLFADPVSLVMMKIRNRAEERHPYSFVRYVKCIFVQTRNALHSLAFKKKGDAKSPFL